MTDEPCDLLIRAGRVFCPASGLDSAGAVAVRGGRIVAAGERVAGPADVTLDFPDGVLLPGLIDLHAHPARSGSVFGVDPDEHMLKRGTTTVASQGDAGADNWAEYLAGTIERSQCRVLSAMNLSRVGESTAAGCFEQLENADVDACIRAIELAGEHVWGVSVNASHQACGRTDPRVVIERGLAAAGASGLPLLFGMRRPEDWPLAEQLERLRPGDVVTYCYRRRPHCIVAGGRVLPEVVEARSRGVLFDVGHGAGSFDFDVAAAAIAGGFPPDTISTDLQARHLELAGWPGLERSLRSETPVESSTGAALASLSPIPTTREMHDLPLTMSKLHAAGMPADDVFRSVTQAPAAALNRPRLGTLAAGSEADLTLFEWDDADGLLTDTSGNRRKAGRWKAILTVRAGTIYGMPDE